MTQISLQPQAALTVDTFLELINTPQPTAQKAIEGMLLADAYMRGHNEMLQSTVALFEQYTSQRNVIVKFNAFIKQQEGKLADECQEADQLHDPWKRDVEAKRLQAQLDMVGAIKETLAQKVTQEDKVAQLSHFLNEQTNISFLHGVSTTPTNFRLEAE